MTWHFKTPSTHRDGDKQRVLPCQHRFHMECIDQWLSARRPLCPICKCAPWLPADAVSRTPLTLPANTSHGLNGCCAMQFVFRSLMLHVSPSERLRFAGCPWRMSTACPLALLSNPAIVALHAVSVCHYDDVRCRWDAAQPFPNSAEAAAQAATAQPEEPGFLTRR